MEIRSDEFHRTLTALIAGLTVAVVFLAVLLLALLLFPQLVQEVLPGDVGYTGRSL
jgi:hypothetical protein